MSNAPHNSKISAVRKGRRDLLKALAVAGVAAGLSRSLRAAGTASDAPRGVAVARYLSTLRRADGGYAWEDQVDSHLTPSWAAIGCFRILGLPVPDSQRVARFVRENPPSKLKKLGHERRMFDFQQLQALTWLGADTSEFHERIRNWKKPGTFAKHFEQNGNPVLHAEVGPATCRAVLGLTTDDLGPEFGEFLAARRRPNGTYNNTPAGDGSDGHVMNTWWAFETLQALGQQTEARAETIAWLQACQLAGGGFTWAPKPEFAGVDDVTYTWAAVRALDWLGAKPRDAAGCIAYLNTLANADGGFADRPGWLSNALASYRALDALLLLGALDTMKTVVGRRPKVRSALPADLQAFTIQLEAHGQGSPAEAVDLARAFRIHLWGAKNAKPGWIARAQALADAQKVPVKFFVSDEEYDTWIKIPGLGTYSHVTDMFAPQVAGASLASETALTWPEFRQRRLATLQQGGGDLVWQFNENEEITRLYLDDSLARGGFAAISAYHYNNPDFSNSEAFLHRWRGQIPFVALQDAHGTEPWWAAETQAGFRTVFLATEPTWEGWQRALRENWIVPVRHDGLSGGKTWTHSASPDVLQRVQAQAAAWQWWDNPAIVRPSVSIVALRPEDEFEVGRPARGLALRVRCSWDSGQAGALREPHYELAKLFVDEREQKPTLVTVKHPSGTGISDHYHLLDVSELNPGPHTARAEIVAVGSRVASSRTVAFEVKRG